MRLLAFVREKIATLRFTHEWHAECAERWRAPPNLPGDKPWSRHSIGPWLAEKLRLEVPEKERVLRGGIAERQAGKVLAEMQIYESIAGCLERSKEWIP